jgi:predicted MPP superfamily phosphohydrolase
MSSIGVGAYAAGIEPNLALNLTSYAITPANWPIGVSLKIAIIADLHACVPQMSQDRIARICEATNRLEPDLIVILGDFNGGHMFVTRAVTPPEWAEPLSHLHAPLGVFAILGNHDLWHGALPSMRSDFGESIRKALRRTKIELLENDATQVLHGGQPLWIAGLADQMAHWISRGHYRGIDDLDGTLARIQGDAPVILLAHEPMIFSRVPHRVAVTLCGHTHGGQVDLPFIGSPYAAARFGRNHVYGHVQEDGRHMVISAGLGTSIIPVRFLRPPEIVELTLGGPPVSIG